MKDAGIDFIYLEDVRAQNFPLAAMARAGRAVFQSAQSLVGNATARLDRRHPFHQRFGRAAQGRGTDPRAT